MNKSVIWALGLVLSGMFVSAQTLNQQAPQGFDVENAAISHGKLTQFNIRQKPLEQQEKLWFTHRRDSKKVKNILFFIFFTVLAGMKKSGSIRETQYYS